MADKRDGEDRVVCRPEGKSRVAPPNFSRSTLTAVGAALAAAALGYCLKRFFRRDQRRPRLDPDAPASSSASTTGHCETVEGIFVITSPPWDDSGLTKGGEAVGLHCHKEQLIRLLLEDETDVLVRGGSGMTALVRKVCEDFHAMEHFGTIAWITAPQSYDPGLIREEILLQLLFENAYFPDDFDADHLPPECFTNSTEHNKGTCLIVIDNMVDWRTHETFKTVSSSFKTCRVIFMARRDRPINTYGRACVIFDLEDLSVEEPWPHFCLKKAAFFSTFERIRDLIHQKWQTLSEEAIVLHLCNRSVRKWAPMFGSPCSPWLDVCHYFNVIEQVLEIVSNDNRGLCLLYLSNLSSKLDIKGKGICCERVYRLWVAEGILPDLGEAESVFNYFLDRKWIHPVQKRRDGELSTFQLDVSVKGIISTLCGPCKLLTIASEGSANRKSVNYLCVQGTIGSVNEEFQFSSTFFCDRSLELSIHCSSEEVEDVDVTMETPSFPSKLKHSKVLDLTDAPFQMVPDGLGQLIDLRYWSIRKTSIDRIPDSIGGLTHLEFLDAKHSLVTELPPQVAKLKRIRHILIYHHEKDPLMESYTLIGFKALCRVGGFLELEKLCFVEADERTLKDLRNLTKLRRLGITKLRKEHGEELCISLEKLKELKSLNVHALDEDEIIDLHGLSSPPEYLKRLYLHGRLEELPDWIWSCKWLTKIVLRWSHLEEDLLSTLGKLPELVELELRRAYDGDQLDFKKGQFPKLKILLLEELEELKSMSLEKETMPCLEDLTFSGCEWLETIPSGIEHIPTIRKLVFFDMSREFYEKVRAEHEKDEYKKFEHIPEVHFTRWRAAHWKTLSFPGVGKDN